MPSTTDQTTDIKTRIQEVLAAMPKQEWRDGGPVEWGPEGNKARALHLAATLGHLFDKDCKSCESDLWLVLKNAVK